MGKFPVIISPARPKMAADAPEDYVSALRGRPCRPTGL